MFSHETNYGQPMPTPLGNNENHPDYPGKLPHPEHPGKPPHPEHPDKPPHPEHPDKPPYPDHPENPPHPVHPDPPVNPETPITIIVNGQDKPLPIGTKQISYDEVVTLAYPGQGDNGVNIIYTVSYSNGPEMNPKGNLVKGKVVLVREGMIFNVSRSDKS